MNLDYFKKNASLISGAVNVILLVVLIFILSVNMKQTDDIKQLTIDNSSWIIKMAFQKSEGNVYTGHVQWDNGTLYIPVLYRGAIITLVTTNYSTYENYNTAKLYRWIDEKYYESGNYGCVGFNIMAIAGADMANPFSTEYADASCTGDGTWINLDAPLDSNNGGTSGIFRLSRGLQSPQ